jgi:hypothetical protein
MYTNVDWVALATFLLAVATFFLAWQTTFYRRKDLRNRKIDEVRLALRMADAWNSEATSATEVSIKDIQKLIELKERAALIPSSQQQDKLDSDKQIEGAKQNFRMAANISEKVNEKLFELKTQLSGIDTIVVSLKDRELKDALKEFNDSFDTAAAEIKALDDIDKTSMSQIDNLKILKHRDEAALKYFKQRSAQAIEMLSRCEALRK